MRIALISDLHGNEVSLRAVLRDSAEQGVDRVVCLGDVATLGPEPCAVLAALERAGCSCILGNHDAFMLDPQLIRTYSELPEIITAVDWCRAQLSASDLAFIARFETSLRIEMDGGVDLLLFHGSPRSNMEDLLATTPQEKLDLCLGAERAAVMAGGHTHIQMLRQHRGTWLVNPGSVGMPFKEYVAGKTPQIMPYAEYAVIETRGSCMQVCLRRVAVERRELYAAAHGSGNPICRFLEQQYA